MSRRRWAAQNDVGVGGCSLVDAITAANTDRQTNGCLPGSGADTITLPAGSTQLLTSGPYYSSGPTGLPVISSAIVIDGNGSTIARDPQAPPFRILVVDSVGDLVLQEATVTGGISSSMSGGSGGGIFNRGTTTLTNSTVSGNSASFDLFGAGSGGGVSNYGTLTLSSSTVSGNSAAGGGGGIVNFSSGTLTLTNSTVSDNTANSGGGGVFNYGDATVSLANSTVSGNSAGYDGGGLRNSGTLDPRQQHRIGKFCRLRRRRLAQFRDPDLHRQHGIG